MPTSTTFSSWRACTRCARSATLSPAEITALAEGIQRGLRPSLEKGGAFYEQDLFGQHGGFKLEDILIGYREGQPCPTCGTAIAKIKTGGTSQLHLPALPAVGIGYTGQPIKHGFHQVTRSRSWRSATAHRC